MAMRRDRREDNRDRPYGGRPGVGPERRDPAPISVHIPEELAGGVIG
eukprot:SAG25_NODE_4003_length_909_cov_1.362963_1_plen_46_part_10